MELWGWALGGLVIALMWGSIWLQRARRMRRFGSTVGEVTADLSHDGIVGPVITRVIEEEIDPIQDYTQKTLMRHEGNDGVIALMVLSRSRGFKSTSLFAALRGARLVLTEKGIFEKYYPVVSGGDPQIMYRVVSATEPGTFHKDAADVFYKGLLLFMVLPCSSDPEPVFESMLTTAKQVARILGGDVCDQNRNILTKEYLDSIKERLNGGKQAFA